jgi:hypothetical protein
MIYVLIPTGRIERTKQCITVWKEKGFSVVMSTWLPEVAEAIGNMCEVILGTDRSTHPKQINYLTKLVFETKPDADAIISAADDLWPFSSYDDIAKAVAANQGKIIWVRDMLFDTGCTHPIITRGWFGAGRPIFDEQFHHNYTDLDFMIQNAQDGELVKCFDLACDHRHPIKVGRMDFLNLEAQKWDMVDNSYFHFKRDGVNIDNLFASVKEYHLR